jgi:hypothetical protein
LTFGFLIDKILPQSLNNEDFEMFDINAIESPIDRMGVIRAQMADLQAQYDAIADFLKNSEIEKHEGSLFVAHVSTVSGRSTLDSKAAEAKLRELGVTNRWFANHQKEVKGYTKVVVTARKSA